MVTFVVCVGLARHSLFTVSPPNRLSAIQPESRSRLRQPIRGRSANDMHTLESSSLGISSFTLHPSTIKGDSIVVFSSINCGACYLQDIELQRVSELRPDITVLKVDATKHSKLCNDWSVKALPALFVFTEEPHTFSFVGLTLSSELLKCFPSLVSSSAQ